MRILFACTLLFSFALIGCDSGTDPKGEDAVPPPPTDSAAVETESEEDVEAARMALADLAAGESYPFSFTATDLDGNQHSLADYEGKVVIVDFWGTWCPPCRAEIPSFVALQEKYGDQGFQMLGLNYERGDSAEENLQQVIDFAAENNINYPCMMGDDETRAQVPDFRGYPTTFFIDRTGKVRMTAVGLHEEAYLEAIIKALLAES